MAYKYTLIISQYYHSRHSFIVKHDENFIGNARKFAIELMAYKREQENKRGIYLGDLDEKYTYGGICPRYNINDSGDIYFTQTHFANNCKDIAIQYARDSFKESRGYKKKAVVEAISKHHNYNRVKEIVEKYFEIV